MKITPVKGTNDYLPAQAELRNYLQKKICETYEQAGFQRISTPIIEDIENLDKSEGGDNLNLIFKIMKRGEKLKKAIASQNPDNIADMGLRYDLTLPLSRYYANNRASFTSSMRRTYSSGERSTHSAVLFFITTFAPHCFTSSKIFPARPRLN